ncbi:MAG: NAD(P)(+) transhydrogenase (Re/Si-specific) subunit alpha [Acidobacteria bacterium]|nr:NAD(P)(+) transhydrogenase (Re/Si-specific) subunit alpha [Acidobacteriota bacterium]
MKIAVPRETKADEPRIPLIPGDVGKLVKMGAEVVVEAGVGATVGLADSEYTDAGATVGGDYAATIQGADMVLRLNTPNADEIAGLTAGMIHVSHLDPFFNQPLVEQMAHGNVKTICMELIPRTTLAQKMDALSSQASLAGYAAVVLAADRLSKGFPMMMTPAGTLSPSRAFIVGAGVAGLQAIATAKRMGARVEAFDTRPVVAEQVQSLGAKFVKIDIGDTGQTEGGYAKQLTPEQIAMQQKGMAKICAYSDVIVSTAKVFGRKPPLIITEEMVAGMSAGSVIVDMAASEHGGNVAGTKLNEEIVTDNGVHIVGYDNLPGTVALHASQMYSSNLMNFIQHFWDEEAKELKLDTEDEIMAGALVTNDGAVTSEMLQKAYAGN